MSVDATCLLEEKRIYRIFCIPDSLLKLKSLHPRQLVLAIFVDKKGKFSQSFLFEDEFEDQCRSLDDEL